MYNTSIFLKTICTVPMITNKKVAKKYFNIKFCFILWTDVVTTGVSAYIFSH